MSRNIYIFLFILSISICYLLGCSQKKSLRTIDGKVFKITDGDTFSLETKDKTKLKLRLYGVDAPETEHLGKPGQPFGEGALKALSEKILNKNVRINIIDVDQDGISLSVVFLDGKDINLEMVQEGWVWAYQQYLKAPYAAEYLEAEKQAQEKKLGLWSQNNAQAPWEFRQGLNSK